MMHARIRRLLLFLGFSLLISSVLALLIASQHHSVSQDVGDVSDIALFVDRGLIAYSQDACAEASRFLPFYNPPQLKYLKTQFFDIDAEEAPELQLVYWYPWFGHGFPDFQTSFATESVLIFMGILLGENVDVEAAETEPCSVLPPYNLPQLPSRPGRKLTRGAEHNAFTQCAIFCFDPDAMECRALRGETQSIWWMPQHFNVCRGIFPAIFLTDAKGGLGVGGPRAGHVRPNEDMLNHSCYNSMLLSLNGKSSIELKDKYRGYNTFVLSNGDIVSQWGPNNLLFKEQSGVPITEFWHHDNWLLHNGEVVDDMLFELVAITPDTRYVFYSRFGAPLPEEYTLWQMRKQLALPPRLWSSFTLWVYEPATGKRWEVLDEPAWSLRVSRDSRRYGVLKVSYKYEPSPEDWVGHVDFYGARGDRGRITINGATVFDLEGNALEEFDFEEPIVTRAWDWDIDAKIIAYYDEASRQIVVKRLTGEIISELAP